MFKRTLPHITPKRFIVVTVVVMFVAAMVYVFTPAIMPPWIYRWHLPFWLNRNWAVGILPVHFLLTFLVVRWQLVKLPPPPPLKETDMPFRPDLDTQSYWRFIDHRRGGYHY